jgi:hypothetical protein
MLYRGAVELHQAAQEEYFLGCTRMYMSFCGRDCTPQKLRVMLGPRQSR